LLFPPSTHAADIQRITSDFEVELDKQHRHEDRLNAKHVFEFEQLRARWARDKDDWQMRLVTVEATAKSARESSLSGRKSVMMTSTERDSNIDLTNRGGRNTTQWAEAHERLNKDLLIAQR